MLIINYDSIETDNLLILFKFNVLGFVSAHFLLQSFAKTNNFINKPIVFEIFFISSKNHNNFLYHKVSLQSFIDTVYNNGEQEPPLQIT